MLSRQATEIHATAKYPLGLGRLKLELRGRKRIERDQRPVIREILA
jgi:hypothetical protein